MQKSPCSAFRTPKVLLSLTCGLMAAAPLVAAPITPGNIVVLRVGDGAAALTSAAAPVFFEEFNTAGSKVQTIALPTTGTGLLTLGGNASTEGILNRSQSGGRLVFGGYRKALAGTNPSADTGTVTPRVMAHLLPDGTFSTAVEMTDTSTALRSVAAVGDAGGPFYLGTANSVRYAAAPTATSATSVLIDSRNSRQVYLTGNNLFASNGSTAITAKVQAYGTLPTATTAPTPVATLPAPDAVNGMWMTDLNASVAGDDTLYCVDTLDNTFRKFTFDGTTWTARGSISALTSINLSGILTGTVPTIYLTTTTKLFAFTDNSGATGSLSGTLGTEIATAGTNTAFRGVGSFLVPTTPPVASYKFVGITLAGSSVQVQLTGTPGSPPALQSSTDLSTWTAQGTAAETVLNSGIFVLLDPTAGVTRKFYRVAP